MQNHFIRLISFSAVFLVIGIAIGILTSQRIIASQQKTIELLISTSNASLSLPTTSAVNSLTAITEDDPSWGNPDAPVVIVEFSDFRCGYCNRFREQTLPRLKNTYGNNIHIIYRDFPGQGSQSVEAAIASECAHDQGRFWQYHDLLFENRANLNQSTYLQLASELDLDVDLFTTCLSEAEKREEVLADFEAGRSLGVTGTPGFFINDQRIIGAKPFDDFAAIINAELGQ